MNMELSLKMDAILEVVNDLKKSLKSQANKGDIITYEKAMELLECSRTTMDRLRDEGLIKVYRLKGKLYCKYSEILTALEQNQVA